MLRTTSPYLYDPVFLEDIGLNPEKYKAVAVLQTGYPKKIPEQKQREKMENKIKWFDKEEVKK